MRAAPPGAGAAPGAAPAPPATAPAPPLPLPPGFGAAAQVAAQIGNAASADLGYIRIELQPADLGRVDVKLSLDHSGQVMASISADRHDTLALLQRDASSLQQALQQAGLKAGNGSLSFSLNRQGTGGGTGGEGMPRFAAPHSALDAGLAAGPMPPPPRFTARTSGLDIRV